MSTPVTRDLTLLRDAESALVQQALTPAWRQWAQDWGLELPADAALVASPANAASGDLAAASWQALPSTQAAWVHMPAGWRTSLAAELIGRTAKAPLPEDDLSLTVADKALADLLQRWGQVLPAQAIAPGVPQAQARPEQAWLPYAGAVLLTDPRSGLYCLLGRDAYRALLPKPKASAAASAPVGLLGILARHHLPVSLGLGEVEIPVSDLLGLQTGDVIQFPVRLSDELPLTVAADVRPVPALNCQLGQRDGRLAIKVVAKAKAA
ncbi:MAG: FliM/FliN family flagellar motor switch protein [Rubrivivax sp.]|nr:MAG: FliM/FliN family flagellar motor switch protein [Rubrivivax sp.]